MTGADRPAIFLFAGLLALLAAGCSSGLAVRSDVDPAADFPAYRTWNFFDPLGVEGEYTSPIYGELFREAVAREMTERGYRLSEQPDLRVNVTLRGDDKVEMKRHTTPYLSGAYYGRPGGATYGSAVGVGVGVSQQATRTVEASIFIDLVDTKTHRMCWQGVAVVDADDEVAHQLRDAVLTAVDRVFELYPYTTGP